MGRNVPSVSIDSDKLREALTCSTKGHEDLLREHCIICRSGAGSSIGLA